MGFRFQKRITILPGVSINFGKRGASVSLGPRGMKTTISSRGVKHSIGIPGTGIRYETPYSHGRRGMSNPTAAPAATERESQSLPAHGGQMGGLLTRLMRTIFG